MKNKSLIVLIALCIVFLNLQTANAAQVRKRTGYLTTAEASQRMVTTYYLVNNNGARISTQEYDYLEEVNSNLFIAKIDSNYGLIDGSGVRKVSFEYEEITCFKDGVFRIKEKGNYGLMDYSGNIIMPVVYSYLEKIDDRIIKMSNLGSPNLIGLMDYSGKIISQPKYSYIDKINNYMLRVIVGEGGDQSPQASAEGNLPNPAANQSSGSGKKYGLVDYKGRIIVSPQYDYLAKISNTLLKVKKGSSWGRIEYYNGNIINTMFDYQSYW